MPAASDLTGKMMGHGVYGPHSLAQHSAGGFGLPGLQRAARAAAAAHGAEPVVIADLGAAGGRNELQPMTVAIETLRDAGVTAPITVVHTDIPTNDFSALLETVEHDPDTYLRLDDVYTLAAGRSFYGRIFPPESLSLAWSAIAVHWILRIPLPIHGHVYTTFATGEVLDAVREQSTADWWVFLESRAAELRPGAEMVVVGGANEDDGRSGAETLMNALDAAIRAEIASGALTQDEYDACRSRRATGRSRSSPLPSRVTTSGSPCWRRSWTSRRTPTSRHTAKTTTRGSSASRCRASCAPSPSPASSADWLARPERRRRSPTV